MNNETITEPLPSKTARTWWVKFQKQNGKLISVTPRKVNSSILEDTELLAEVDNPVCRDIIKGRKSKKDFAVLWDFKKECWSLDVKSTTLKLKPNDNKLTPISESIPKDICDLHVTLYKKDRTVLIYANLNNIIESMNLADISFISESESKLLDLYITKKNDPDYLVHIVNVNAQQLIKYERTMVTLPSEISKIIDWDNISIYTKPVFKNYGLEIRRGAGKESQIDTDKYCLYSANYQESESDINIYVLNDKLVFHSNLNENHLQYFGGKTKFNILVCDQEIDRFVGNIELDVVALCGDRDYKIDLPQDWPQNALIVHRNKKVRLSYTGERNV
jgi:hypothetical protein